MSVETPRHSVSVAAAVVDDAGRVLAIRRADNGRWEPPGGVLELDETFHEGLIREAREETGITVEPGPLTGVYKNMRRGVVAMVFRCTVLDGAPAATDEVREYRWFTAEEVKTHMDEVYAVRMLDALAADAPVVRAHDGVALLDARATIFRR